MTAQATGSGLRSRKVDPKRPMAVFRYDQVDDLDELSMINRVITKVATGVEKEEEEEHHLKKALEAPTAKDVVIPTPDASHLIDQPAYEKYYSSDFVLPKSLIKFSTEIEDAIGCLYNLTEEDQAWLNEHSDIKGDLTEDDLERYLFALDEIGSKKVSNEIPTLEECAEALPTYDLSIENQPFFNYVYEYFVQKRYEKNKGERIRACLKKEEWSTNPDSDPYVCFRQREIKNFRKARRSDTLALEKLRKLKEDLVKAKQILELVHEREVCRKQLLDVEHLVFEKRLFLRKLRKHLGVTSDHLDQSPEKKIKKRGRRGLDDRYDNMKQKVPAQSLREAAHLVSDMDSHFFEESRVISSEQRIDEKIKREKALNERSGWLDCTEFPFKKSPIELLWGKHFGNEDKSERPFVHCATRRRVGRGGRIIFDRATRLAPDHASLLYNEDDYITDPTPIVPDLDLACYRSFKIAPKDEQYANLQNRPSQVFQHDPSRPLSEKDRRPAATEPPQIVRLPLNQGPGAPKKKTKSSADSRASTKKKTPELDPRTQAVKTMMKQAQKQAQQTQAQLHLHQASQGMAFSGSPTPGFQFGAMANNQQNSRMQQLMLMNQMQQSPNQSFGFNTMQRQPQFSPLYYQQLQQNPQLGQLRMNSQQQLPSFLGQNTYQQMLQMQQSTSNVSISPPNTNQFHLSPSGLSGTKNSTNQDITGLGNTELVIQTEVNSDKENLEGFVVS